MKNMSVIIPVFHQRDLTLNCVKSFVRFCPSNLKLQIIVVENSDDTSYKLEVLNISKDVEWINSPTSHRGAAANAYGIETGMKNVKNDYVCMVHSDTCVTSEDFFNSFIRKIEEGCELVGICTDTNEFRSKCITIIGCLVKSSIVRGVDLYPKDSLSDNPRLEVGDRMHLYCRELNLKTYCFLNTYNNPEIELSLPSPYKELPFAVRVINDKGEVIFLHFSRGTIKTLTPHLYPKKGRLTLPQIIEFCEKNVLKTK